MVVITGLILYRCIILVCTPIIEFKQQNVTGKERISGKEVCGSERERMGVRD